MLCVSFLFGLSSVSIFAQGVDDGQSYFNDNPVDIFITDDSGFVPYFSNIGYTVRPYWRPLGESEWNVFDGLISTNEYYNEIEIYYEIHLTSTIKKNSTFDFKMVINSDGFGSVRASRLSVYDSNWNRAVSDFPTVEINGNTVECLDVWNNKRDVGILGLTFVITNPEFMQFVQPDPEPEPEPEPEPVIKTFKINNTSFDYEDGMSWGEWIASGHNPYRNNITNNYFKISSSGLVQFYNDGDYNKVMYVSGATSNFVYSNNLIDSSIRYSMTSGSAPFSLNQIDYEYNFTLSSLTVTVLESSEVSGGILGWVKNIWNNLTNLPSNIANKISGFFSELGNAVNALGDKILNGIKSLFIPSEESITELKGKFENLLSDRFGAVYESAAIIDNFASAFFNTAQISLATEQSGTIRFPLVEISLAGTVFSFGGWDVDLIPDNFEGIVEMLKILIDVVCTFVFVNALRKKLEALLA